MALRIINRRLQQVKIWPCNKQGDSQILILHLNSDHASSKVVSDSILDSHCTYLRGNVHQLRELDVLPVPRA